MNSTGLLSGQGRCLLPFGSKCKSRREDGFIPASDLGPEFWVPGPRPSFWKRFLGYNNSVPITTYRCTKYGALESYAVKSS
jgi:hypothetical protein